MQASNWLFVAAAYAAAWLVIGGYAVHVHRTLRKARHALAQANASTPTARPWR